MNMNALHPHQKPQRAAFTLIELLTVIAIIAILMGLLMSALGGAKDQARRTEAGATVRNIVNACKSYYNDYGKYPPISSAAGTDFNSFGDTAKGKCKIANNELFYVLRGISLGFNSTPAAHSLNKRQQKYFEGPKAKDFKTPRSGFIDGAGYTPSATAPAGALMDPWGTQYCIVLDTSGNDEINIGTFYSDLDAASNPLNLLRFSAVAFSLGKDGDLGGKGYQGKYRKTGSSEAPDDIVSWQ